LYNTKILIFNFLAEVEIFVGKSERDNSKTNTPKISNYDNYSEIKDISQNKEISENLFQLLSSINIDSLSKHNLIVLKYFR
jgi:hypothetical protein